MARRPKLKRRPKRVTLDDEICHLVCFAGGLKCAIEAKLREAMEAAALIGSCAERDRTLRILATHGLTAIATEICSVSITKVLQRKEDEEILEDRS